jgi:ribose transport system substrate-binding protein
MRETEIRIRISGAVQAARKLESEISLHDQIHTLGTTVKKWKCVLSIPGDAIYLREQVAVAKTAAERLGVELQVVDAEMDPVNQGQQLLRFVQSPPAERPDGILLEPVSAAGLPRVAEAAVAAGIGWLVSNAQVEYLGTLRRNAKTPVFLVSQDHVEVGRIQGRQLGAILPDGGTALYVRGPSMSSLASRRFEGLDSAKPKNVDVKSVKVQGSTAESAYTAVSSWLKLSTVKPEGTRVIASQNADFIFGARKAFETTTDAERKKWLALPCVGVGIQKQIKPLVDQGVLHAAVLTSVTMDVGLEMLVRAMRDRSQPKEQTFVEAHSYPTLEELAKKRYRS